MATLPLSEQLLIPGSETFENKTYALNSIVLAFWGLPEGQQGQGCAGSGVREQQVSSLHQVSFPSTSSLAAVLREPTVSSVFAKMQCPELDTILWICITITSLKFDIMPIDAAFALFALCPTAGSCPRFD